MKRIVYISEKNFGIESQLAIAENISKQTGLPISKVNPAIEESDEIYIASIPEIEKCDFDKVIKKNYIHTLDYTNEYIDLSKNLLCLFTVGNKTLSVKPIINEKHTVKFRTRFNVIGNYTFYFLLNNNIINIEDNSFEVI
jgi:hypothetical protein